MGNGRFLTLFPDEEEDEEGEVEGMQVSIMIRMPDPKHSITSLSGTDGYERRASGISTSTSTTEGESGKLDKGKQRLSIVKEPLEPEGEGEEIGHYVIGIMEVPWKVPWRELVPDEGEVTKSS